MIPSNLKSLQGYVKEFEKLVILTGAGVSTDSGIPDYRGPNGVYLRNQGYKPIQYQQFVQQHHFRQRYWARSFLGWPRMSLAKPNESHRILSAFQSKRQVELITQNVDGLHRQVGTRDIEMHGSLSNVSCLSCGYTTLRDQYQKWLQTMNPVVYEWSRKYPEKMTSDVSSSVNPDGDVEIDWNYDEFKYPDCPKCHGIMKPTVVFFGENIDPLVRDQTFDAVDGADCLVAIGTSLTVYSAFRLVKRAYDQRKPIVILNLGPTRADDLATIKFDEPISTRLRELA